MRTSARQATAVVSAALLAATVTGAAQANATTPDRSSDPAVTTASFTFESDAGAHPVDGRTGDWTAPDFEIMVWEYENILKIDAANLSGSDFIRVELNASGHVPLQTGDYPGARTRDADPNSPGMLVVSNGLGCGDVYGEFEIDRIERDGAGTLVALDASFTQSCGAPDSPALNGRIHFQD